MKHVAELGADGDIEAPQDLLSNVVRLALEYQDQAATVHADPRKAEGFVEETLRYMNRVLPDQGLDVRVIEVTDSRNYLVEEQPGAVIASFFEFFR